MACNWWCGLKLYPGIINQQRQHLGGDPYFNDVTLLLHMNGADASTVFTDNSNSAHSPTAVGNAQIDTAESKWGGASGLFDGTGDRLDTTYVAGDFDWFTEDYTVEFWINAAAFGSGWQSAQTTPSLIGRMNATTSSNYWSFGPMNDGKLCFYYWNGAQNRVYSAAAVPTSQWVHCAMCLDGSNIKLFIDGNLEVTTAVSGTPLSASENLTIGMAFNAAITCSLDDVRITKGVARYTADFTPPTREFPNNSTELSLLQGLVSWWSLDETSGDRIDSHGSNDTSIVGSVGNTTGVVGNAATFSGSASTDYLLKTSATGLSGAQDFSIVGWARTDQKFTDGPVITHGTSGNANSDWLIRLDGGGYVRFQVLGSSTTTLDATSYGLIANDTWMFIHAYHDKTAAEIGISIDDGTYDTAALIATITHTATELRIGNYGFEELDGMADELAFYNRLLLPAEVTAIYNGGAGIAYPG
jgi:hypothetical protein